MHFTLTLSSSTLMMKHSQAGWLLWLNIFYVVYLERIIFKKLSKMDLLFRFCKTGLRNKFSLFLSENWYFRYLNFFFTDPFDHSQRIYSTKINEVKFEKHLKKMSGPSSAGPPGARCSGGLSYATGYTVHV